MKRPLHIDTDSFIFSKTTKKIKIDPVTVQKTHFKSKKALTNLIEISDNMNLAYINNQNLLTNIQLKNKHGTKTNPDIKLLSRADCFSFLEKIITDKKKLLNFLWRKKPNKAKRVIISRKYTDKLLMTMIHYYKDDIMTYLQIARYLHLHVDTIKKFIKNEQKTERIKSEIKRYY